MKNAFFLLMLYLVANSCNPRPPKRFKVIEVPNHLSKAPQALDYLIDTILFIPLETTPQSLVGDYASQIILTEDRIILYESTNGGNISFFDRHTGKAIKKLVPIGEGPGEYSKISGITYNPFNREIEANVSFSKKSLLYDLNANFKKEEPRTISYDAKFYLTNKTCVYACNKLSNGEITDKGRSHKILLEDKETRSWSAFEPVTDHVLNLTHLSTGENFHRYGNQLVYFENFNPEIKTIDQNRVYPRYFISFQKNPIPESYWDKVEPFTDMTDEAEKHNFPFNIGYFFENDQTIFFTYSYDNQMHAFAWDKKTNQSVLNTPSLIFEKWKLQIPIGLHGCQEGLLTLWPAFVFKNTLENHPNPSLLPKAFHDIHKTLKATDNPVLMMIKLK